MAESPRSQSGPRALRSRAEKDKGAPTQREPSRKLEPGSQWKLAVGFRRNEHMERLAELKERDPVAFWKLSPLRHMALGRYLIAKEAAEAEGIHADSRGPEPETVTGRAVRNG